MPGVWALHFVPAVASTVHCLQRLLHVNTLQYASWIVVQGHITVSGDVGPDSEGWRKSSPIMVSICCLSRNFQTCFRPERSGKILNPINSFRREHGSIQSYYQENIIRLPRCLLMTNSFTFKYLIWIYFTTSKILQLPRYHVISKTCLVQGI